MVDLWIKESALVAMEKHCKNNFNELFQNITLDVMNMKPLHKREI